MFGPLFEISWSTRARHYLPLLSMASKPLASVSQQQEQQERETAVAAVAGSKLYVKSEFIIATTFKTWRCFCVVSERFREF